MRIAVCDDLCADREKVKRMLSELSEEEGISFEIEEYENGEELFESVKKASFDIILLDIYMGGQKGIDIARFIKAAYPMVKIIFTTTSSDYAVESYSLNVEGYLVKPLKYELFKHCILKHIDEIKSSYKYIKVRNNKVMINIPVNTITYIETYSKQTVIHTLDKSIDTKLSADEMNLLIENDNLYRVTRSFIINFDFVDYIENDNYILVTGEKIAIPRRMRNECKEAYSNYFWKTIEK